MDKITIDRIKLAHPKFRDALLKQYQEINSMLPKGVRLRFAYVYRTIAEQDALFKQRPKVTNAKGGQSIHNYGLAFDIVLLYDKDGNETFETASWEQNSHWMQVVAYFKSKGWEAVPLPITLDTELAVKGSVSVILVAVLAVPKVTEVLPLTVTTLPTIV